VNPVTIVLMVNKPHVFDKEYRRYFTSQLRDTLPFPEIPIKLVFRERRGLLERGLMKRVRNVDALAKTRSWVADENAALPDEVAAELDKDEVKAALAAEVLEEDREAAALEVAPAGVPLDAELAPIEEERAPNIEDLLYGEDADVVRRQIQRKKGKKDAAEKRKKAKGE
jgi:hypothetical protein